ncbi:hypothetical protein [Kitasatospora nipponensis]|uniref:hypothetical protein n=1 Tax=Kitasatospora nipponensis TaxID=258049 RepID=UPI0031D509BE
MQNAEVPPQDRSAGSAADPATPNLREDLLRYADLGGFTLAADTHAWYAAAGAVTGPEEARAASTVLAEVRGGDLAGVREAAGRLAAEAALREPVTLAEVTTLVGLLRRVRETATTLRSGAYEADLDALAAATANGSWRRERGLKLSWGRRRSLRAEARRLAVAARPRRDALHVALVAAAAEREEWQALAPAAGSGARPVDAELLELTGQCTAMLAAALGELGRLLAPLDLTALDFDELTELVERLADDEGTLYRLPELRALRATLEAGGLTDLLAELAAAGADRNAAEAAYLWAAEDRRHAEDAEGAGDAAEAREVEAAAEDEAEAVVEQIIIPAQSVDSDAAVAEPEAVQEPEVEVAAVAEPVVEAEPEVEVVAEVEVEAVAEPVVEAEPEVEVAVEVEAAVEPEPVVEPEVEVVAEVEPEVVVEPVVEPVAEVEVVVEPVVEAEPEVVAEAVAEPEVEVEPVVPVVEAEPEVEAVVEPEPVVPVVEETPAPVARVRRPRRPEVTAGRPITAYSAEELLALVRWIDSDFVQRTDDELLRATMKELGFARLGPRIKEALGAAVAAARPGTTA